MDSSIPRQVAILGAGSMGTALALLFARKVRGVRLWARDADRAAEMEATRVNARHLPWTQLPANVRVTADLSVASDGTDLVVLAIPTIFLRETLKPFAGVFPSFIPALSAVKGIERESFARPTEIILSELGPRPVAVLSGPSHAEEIARGLPASVVVASESDPLNSSIQETLNSSSFRVYTNTDLPGVEYSGALKNILGIAAGICDGLGFGDNAKAALLTRGLAEVSRFSCEMGARPATFLGLAGVGDVITTCYSPFGRNRAVGIKVGQGASLSQVLAGMSDIAEGVTTAVSVHFLARERGIAMPITDEVYRILHEGKPPRSAVADLMFRDPKDEWP